jgi:hypothetical protein
MKPALHSPMSLAVVKVCLHSAPRCRTDLRRQLQPGRARQRGTTLLESAVMISVLLLMMFGVVGFGTALYTYHFVSNTGIGLDPTKVTTTTTWVAPPNNLAVCTTQPKSPGCVVKVQVQYSFQFLFPLLPSGFTMQSTSQMVISQ